MLRKWAKKTQAIPTIEVMLDHDGRNWIVSGSGLNVQAQELDDIDRQLEAALQPRLDREGKLHIFMTSNNELIPEWMRPYMNHYFNRQLELPLRY